MKTEGLNLHHVPSAAPGTETQLTLSSLPDLSQDERHKNNVKNTRYLNHSGKESEKGCRYTLRYAHTHTYK